MQNQSTSKAQQNARVLRSAMTDAERKLWGGLRNEQLGVKFRRQHPLGHYIADFACLCPKLIVELDGSQHHAQRGYDARRDDFFRTQGFEVLRFGSNDPFVNFDGVLQAVLGRVNALKVTCPHPNLPPEGEGALSRSHP